MDSFVLLYVWLDVAIVHLLCALPLAGMLAFHINRRLSVAASLGFAVFFLGVSIVLLLGVVNANGTTAFVSNPLLGVVLRAAVAFGVALPAAILLAGRRAWGRDAWKYTALVGGLGMVVLLLPPWTYVSARCRHDVARLGEFLEQSRFGEARTLVHGLLALDARQTWNGRPLTRVADDLERIVRELESRVAAPLAVRASAGERLERARQLAMLGRTEAALAVLQSVRETAAAPEVANLAGTIYESTGAWETALASYRRARTAWESRPPSAAQAAGLLRATTGIAYCQRKKGHYAEAETAYQQMLALSPTADSYFLLAQFYEDAQQSDKARAHARRAMALDPARYRREGEKLIRKLTVFHFGCLHVFTAEND